MLQLIFHKIRKDAKKKVLQNFNGEYIISTDGRVAFLIDVNQNVLYIADENNQLYKYNKDQILEVNLEDENERGYKRNLFPTVIWYQIGKMIDKEGGLQKVLSQLVTEKEIVKVKKIFLRVVVKDFKNPYYDLIVFESGFASNKKEGYKLATRWYSLINVLKHQ